MRISPFVYGAFVIIVFLGTIFAFQAAGVWSVTGKTDSSGKQIQPSSSDVNTIKGWMTLEQIASAYDLQVSEILNQFNLPAETPQTTAVKDLESDEFSVENLRLWLDNRKP
jgi:hypothetical protein